MLDHLWCDAIHLLDCIENRRSPFDDLHLFIDRHRVDVLSRVEVQCGFRFVEVLGDLLGHLAEPAGLLLLAGRVRCGFLVHAEGAGKRVMLLQLLLFIWRLHEL